MIAKLRGLLKAIPWLLPNGAVKHRILNALGNSIDATAIVRPNLVWNSGEIRLNRRSILGGFNVIKNVRTVHLGEDSCIGRMNLISSHPVYGELYEHGSRLMLGRGAIVTSRHSVDCSGGVTLGEFSGVFGHKTTILSHSIDVRRNAQVAKEVEIGLRSFVSSDCLLLAGAKLPARSLLAAGSTLTASISERVSGFWAGSPARRIKEVEGLWFERVSTHTKRVWVPDTQEIVENAF